MANTRTFPIADGIAISEVAEKVAADMRAQGFEVTVQAMGENASTLVVKKDRTGFSNIMGLGLECRATLTKSGQDAINSNIESEWTNKIVAIAVGWFLCLIPAITGVVGCVNQDGLQKKIETSLMVATAN